MKQSSSQKPMSPVNIDQNRAVGQDSFTEGSRMGREANKEHGFPGEEEQAEATGAQPHEDAIRQEAYAVYQRRVAAGDTSENEANDWLEAEARLRQQRSD